MVPRMAPRFKASIDKEEGVPHAAEEKPTDLLVVDALAKAFRGQPAVRSVSFTVSKGETVAFLGPNGAGKSTTLRMIAGYLDPDDGRVVVAGESLRNNREAAQAKMGYLAEGAPVFLDLTARAYLSYLARIHRLARPDREHAIERVATGARITDVMHRPLYALSKGYRRRVALAGAMIHDPPVLILDEPTDGLDPNQKQAMRAWLAEIRSDKAILISTHQLDEVEAMCARSIVIAAGQILADGPTREVLGDNPLRSFTNLTDAPVENSGATA